MRAVVQRVSEASVSISGRIVSEINNGLLVFIAILPEDTNEIMKWMCHKLVNLRIFPDAEGKMNKSLLETQGDILLISNFTLYGDVHKGFRPSFVKSAQPNIAEPIYNSMLKHLKENFQLHIASGEFGAKMDVKLVNEGPVTIIINKEANDNSTEN